MTDPITTDYCPVNDCGGQLYIRRLAEEINKIYDIELHPEDGVLNNSGDERHVESWTFESEYYCENNHNEGEIYTALKAKLP